MECKVIGVRKKSFDTKDGATVNGYDVHCCYKASHVDAGLAVERFFLSEGKCGSWVPAPNDVFRAEYNRFGKLDNIEVVK